MENLYQYPDDPLAEGNYRRIARRADLSHQHVSRVIRGVRGSSMDVFVRIAEAAGVSLDKLYARVERNRRSG